MKVEDKGKIVIIFSSAMLLIALFVLILFLIPRINQIKTLATEIANKQAEYEVGLLRVSLAQKAVDTITQAKKESDLLGVAIPESPRAEEAILQVSTSASSSGLQVTSAEVIKASEGILSITVSTRGSYDNTISFVSKLKNNLRPVKLVDLTMTKDGDDVINANFNLELPYLYQVTKSPVSSQVVVE